MVSSKLIKIGLYLIPGLAIAGLLYFLYSVGVSNGKSKVEAEWNKATLEYNAEISKLESEYRAKEQIHQAENRRITDELFKAEKDHAVTVAAINADYSERLLRSTERASIYQRQANAGAVEQLNLASHAAQLDRSLVEGIKLVEEFSATVRQRDRQLIALGEQIINDRSVLGDTDGNTKE